MDESYCKICGSLMTDIFKEKIGEEKFYYKYKCKNKACLNSKDFVHLVCYEDPNWGLPDSIGKKGE